MDRIILDIKKMIEAKEEKIENNYFKNYIQDAKLQNWIVMAV